LIIASKANSNRTIPIVIISTEESLKDQAKGLELGDAEFLLKPIQLHLLIDVIKTTFGK
jgi:DNA-binding response OmpR family regulator